jgi:hypothetical protein
MSWTYRGEPFTQDMVTDDLVGFVYIISDRHAGKRYVGKKTLWTKKVRSIKKKKKKFKVPSDWEKYWGSNKDLLLSVEKNDPSLFSREILHLCQSKGACNYLEAREQFERDVLLDDAFYNEWIACKVHRGHLRTLRK